MSLQVGANVGMELVDIDEHTPRGFEDNFHDYVERTRQYSAVNYEEASKYVDQGEEFLQRLQAGELDSLDPTERRKFIIPLVWCLLAKAYDQQEGFLQGMFVFEDPGHLVANFFGAVATARLSSHYQGRVIGESFGIDQPHGLPYGFRTVLFGKLDVRECVGEWTFLKPENYGVESCSELVFHLLDYCWYSILKFCGRVIKPHDRTELITPGLQRHADLLKNAGFKVDANMSQRGLSGLFHAVLPFVQAPDTVTALTAVQRKTLLQFLKKAIPSYQWLAVRSGHEVVLSEREDPYMQGLLNLMLKLRAMDVEAIIAQGAKS